MLVFFGLWCHDSEREVGRLLKLIDAAHLDLNNLTLVAVNTQKQLPAQYEARFKLERTPTIFVLHQQRVLGKIVERPQVRLAKALADIVMTRG